MGIDYYGVLQIPRISTNLEIKKAYRNLALDFHPERLKEPHAKKVFALLGEAYDVLGDPLKRAIFDQYGEEGLKNGVPTADEYYPPYHYHGDPMKTYKDFFGTASPYADLLDYLNKPPPQMYSVTEKEGLRTKQPPVMHDMKLTLKEMFFGGVKKMKIHRLVFTDNDKCITELKEKILSVPFKPGIREGTEVTFYEEGDQNPSHIPADIIFTIKERPDAIFTREEDNLVLTSDITLEKALLGTLITVKTLDSRTVRIPITDVVYPGYEKIVENEGMPVVDKYPQKGNLILRFNIIFPGYLPKSSKDLLQQGFSLAKIGGGINQHELINKLVLADKILRVDPDEQLPPI